MRAKFGILWAIPAILFSACSSLQMGKDYYDRGDYESAKKVLVPLCNDNNYEAQYKCGQLALIERDTAQAIDWFVKSANGQYPLAFWAVGILANHSGNEAVAASWFNVGARWGEPSSINELQKMGQPVPEADLLYTQQQGQAAAYATIANSLNQMNQQLAENRRKQEEQNQAHLNALQAQTNSIYNNRTSPYNPDNSPYNPDNSVYNPKNSPYNPDNSRYNPSNSQYNPGNSIYNPDNSPYNPDNSKYNPKNSVYNPNNSPYNPNRNHIYDNSGNSLGYVVEKQSGGFNLFDNSGNLIGYTTTEGRAVFNSQGNNVGYMVRKENGGYNLFLNP